MSSGFFHNAKVFAELKLNTMPLTQAWKIRNECATVVEQLTRKTWGGAVAALTANCRDHDVTIRLQSRERCLRRFSGLEMTPQRVAASLPNQWPLSVAYSSPHSAHVSRHCVLTVSVFLSY
jgi:hypothetical protein